MTEYRVAIEGNETFYELLENISNIRDSVRLDQINTLIDESRVRYGMSDMLQGIEINDC